MNASLCSEMIKDVYYVDNQGVAEKCETLCYLVFASFSNTIPGICRECEKVSRE